MYVPDQIVPIEDENEVPDDSSCESAETQQRLAHIRDEVALVLLEEGSEAAFKQTLHSNPPGFQDWVALGSELQQ